jgi:hypothetical protein
MEALSMDSPLGHSISSEGIQGAGGLEGKAGQAVSLPCPKCQAPLSPGSFAATHTVACPSCATEVTAYLFPALFHNTIASQAPETLMTDNEASCFFHPAKKAVVTCASCGRFLCGLCDLDWEGQHLCATCLETGRKKGKMKNLENQRILYDHIALFITIMPCLIPFFGWLFTCITAPLALYLAIRYWNAPVSLVSRSKFRFVLVMLLSSAQIFGWVWVLLEIFHQAMK